MIRLIISNFKGYICKTKKIRVNISNGDQIIDFFLSWLRSKWLLGSSESSSSSSRIDIQALSADMAGGLALDGTIENGIFWICGNFRTKENIEYLQIHYYSQAIKPYFLWS